MRQYISGAEPLGVWRITGTALAGMHAGKDGHSGHRGWGESTRGQQGLTPWPPCTGGGLVVSHGVAVRMERDAWLTRSLREPPECQAARMQHLLSRRTEQSD